MEKMKFTIPIAPITKKNHQQIILNNATGRRMVIPSKQYKEYENVAGWYMPKANIDYPVNVKARYYMPTRRRVDLINLHEALHDVMVKYGVVIDDNSNIIVSTDGSRVLYSKDSPRTEVIIERIEENDAEAEGS